MDESGSAQLEGTSTKCWDISAGKNVYLKGKYLH